MSALPLLTLATVAAAGCALVAAQQLGRRSRPGVRTSSREPVRDEPDTNPFRAVRVLPAASGRRPGRSAGAPLPGDAAPRSSADASDVRRALGTRYRLTAEVPLADLVRFEDRRFGSPAEHRALRIRSAPWVIGERAGGRVRLVVAPEGGLRGLIAAALEAGGVAVWSYERWTRERRRRDPLELRNALVRDGLTLDPPGAPG